MSQRIGRTQLEVQVQLAAPRKAKTVDIAVLRQGTALQFRKNGPGDVIQQVAIEHIDVAIEVKTSQSCDPNARASYVHDIYALLKIARQSAAVRPEDPARCYFILIDRNDPGYGAWTNHDKSPRMRWRCDEKQRIRFRDKGIASLSLHSLKECGLMVSDVQPVYTDVWVKCYVLDSQPGAVACRYVSMRETGLPTALQGRIDW